MRKKTQYRGITQLGRKRYEVRVRTTDPKTGKRKDIKRLCEGTLQDAREYQLGLTYEAREDTAQKRQRMTLGVYAKSWLEQVCLRVKPSTAMAYAKHLRNILSSLGDHYLDALRPGDIERYQAQRIAAGYAGRTIREELRLLRQMSRDAQKEELIDRDFCVGVTLRMRLHEYTEDEPNCLTHDELARLEAEIPPDWKPFFTTMVFTGMRWGEISGLRWQDIDHERGVITIRRTNYQGILGEPKTRKSRRVIPMGAAVANALKEQRAHLEATNNPGLKNGWVFPTRAGTAYRASPFNQILKASLKRAGIDKRVTQHGLRRTFNDLLTRLVSGRVARGIIGHASVQMTDHYSFVDLDEKRAAQAAVLRLVTGANDPDAEPARQMSAEPPFPSSNLGGTSTELLGFL